MLAASSFAFLSLPLRSNPVLEDSSLAFPGDFGTRDLSDRVSRVWWVLGDFVLFCFFPLRIKTFFACISEEHKLLTLSITQHECSGDRGQRNWLGQGTAEHTARQLRWRLGMRLSPVGFQAGVPEWSMDVFKRFSRLAIAETRSPL